MCFGCMYKCLYMYAANSFVNYIFVYVSDLDIGKWPLINGQKNIIYIYIGN